MEYGSNGKVSLRALVGFINETTFTGTCYYTTLYNAARQPFLFFYDERVHRAYKINFLIVATDARKNSDKLNFKA